ncbi:MAG: hypothetical protein ACREAA_04110 [Candidatus Polarisedimenticolia bacterium]
MFVLGLVVPVPVWAYVQPPNRINYQGVLRDQNGNPLTGTYDMLFRFMDAETAGNEIMVDPHTASTSNAVTVSGGLFSVVLGSGTLIDGSGPGTYTSLFTLFRDYANIWLEVQVGAEPLSPRTKFHSVPFALNATLLDGKWPGEFIDTTTLQSKTAGLLVSEGFWQIPALEGVSTVATGVRGSGPEAGVEGESTGGPGGTFHSDTGTGVRASTGSGFFGGVFTNSTGGTSVSLAGDIGTGVYASTSSGNGGVFTNSSARTSAYLATQSNAASFMRSDVPAVLAQLATIDPISGEHIGAFARGPNIGGFFRSNTYLSYAEIPWFDAGMRAHGSISGGAFDNFTTSAWGLVGYSSYKILGNGAVSFAQNHPDDPDKVIVYAAPEGDEVAVYTRGSGRLVDGEARVALGETFALVANPDIGLTATVTPIEDVIPLAVVEKSTRELVVRGPAGSGAAFDYVVWGLRIGFEEQSIVQPKKDDSKIPSMSHHAKFFEDEPALRDYTALARFEGVEQAVHGKAQLDFSRANSLRDAIGVFVKKEPAPPDAPGGPAGSPVPQALAPVTGGDDAGVSSRILRGAPASEESDRGAGESSRLTTSDTGEGGAPRVPPHILDLFLAEDAIEVGDVVSLSANSPGAVVRSDGPSDVLVIGCAQVGEEGSEDGSAVMAGQVAVATSRMALCRVDAAYGSIAVGDRLSPSPMAGTAMKVDPSLAEVTILGRAIEPLESGTALVRVLLEVR